MSLSSPLIWSDVVELVSLAFIFNSIFTALLWAIFTAENSEKL